jgi:DMSO/TMAO reductase YedYZ molybdopterin-dependent catalytic subunit
MTHVWLCGVVLCSLIGISGHVVYAQESVPPAEDEAPPVTCAGGYAPVFRLGGRVHSPKTFDLDALSQEPLTTVHDFFVAGQGTDSGIFTGVLLWDLLQEAQVITNPAQRNDLFRKAVLITGSDCYETLYAMGELAQHLGGTQQVIVAFKRDDQLLGDTEGMARLINPGDKAGARRVFNIVRIRVLDVQPPGGQP